MALTKILTTGPTGTSVARAEEEAVGSAGGTDPAVRQGVGWPGAGHACWHGQESTPTRQLPSGRSYHSRNHTTCPSPNDSPGATREFPLGARQPAAPDTPQGPPEFEVRTDARVLERSCGWCAARLGSGQGVDSGGDPTLPERLSAVVATQGLRCATPRRRRHARAR
jgi:hypothetical protein